MKLESLFHQLLGLEDSWEVTGFRVREADGTVEISIAEKPALWTTQQCPADGSALRAYDHGEQRRWRHLNIFQYRCEIVCRLPRGKCVECGKVTTVKAPWEGLTKGFTLAFEVMCLLLMRDMLVKRMAAARNALLAPMARVGRTLQKHLAGILAHWESRLTNAFMEGLMSVFSATKRKARGFRTFEYLRAMLYFTGSNLNIPMQPLFHRN